MTELSKEEKFIRHAPCENCGSRDNLAIYSGHTYCFGCQQYKKTNGELPDKIIPKKEIKGMITGITEALPKRRINSETAKLFNYETGTYNNKRCHISNLIIWLSGYLFIWFCIWFTGCFCCPPTLFIIRQCGFVTDYLVK